MIAPPSISSLHIDHSRHHDAMLIALPCEPLGSSNVKRLESVEQTLHSLTQEITQSTLIVDLSGVERYGAGLIGALVKADVKLRRRNRQLIVCGDRHQIMKISRLNLVVPLFTDAESALNSLDGCHRM